MGEEREVGRGVQRRRAVSERERKEEEEVEISEGVNREGLRKKKK